MCYIHFCMLYSFFIAEVDLSHYPVILYMSDLVVKEIITLSGICVCMYVNMIESSEDFSCSAIII